MSDKNKKERGAGGRRRTWTEPPRSRGRPCGGTVQVGLVTTAPHAVEAAGRSRARDLPVRRFGSGRLCTCVVADLLVRYAEGGLGFRDPGPGLLAGGTEQLLALREMWSPARVSPA